MKPMNEVRCIGLVMLVTLFLSFSGAGADCYIDSTAGYVGFWRAWEDSWCGEGLKDTVVAAFNYWGIGDAPEELPVFRFGEY
jgi:hypothetical protein